MSKKSKSEQFPKLSELLTEDRISLKVSVSDWKEAITRAGDMLVKTGAVEPRYIKAMIKFKEELGPYIVITKGVALPHARPEDGVLKTCFALTTLKKPVEFGNIHNDPVDLVIAFGATDNSLHVKALAQIAKILQNQGDTKSIRNSGSKIEVLKILKKYE